MVVLICSLTALGDVGVVINSVLFRCKFSAGGPGEVGLHWIWRRRKNPHFQGENVGPLKTGCARIDGRLVQRCLTVSL